MSDKPSSPPPTDARAVAWRLTLVIPPALWVSGYLLSRLFGAGAQGASLKAIAYALSWLAGWGIYLLVKRPGSPSQSGAFLVVGNSGMITSATDSLPFPVLLALGVGIAVAAGLLLGLASRRPSEGRKRAPGPEAHPLSDDEVDRREGRAPNATIG